MKLIDVVLRGRHFFEIPVTVINLKKVKSFSLRNELYLLSDSIKASPKRIIGIGGSHDIAINSGIGTTSCTKCISVSHDIAMDSYANPGIIREITLMESEIILTSELLGLHTGQYTSLSELDSFSLGDIDARTLDDIGYTEA